MNFHEFLKTKRLEKGMTLQELAEKAGISRPYLNQIESGTRNPPSEKILRKLGEALGISASTMFMFAKGNKVPSEVIQQSILFNKMYNELSEKYNANVKLSDEERENKEFQEIFNKWKKIFEQQQYVNPYEEIEDIVSDLFIIGKKGQQYIRMQINVYKSIFLNSQNSTLKK